MIQQIHSHSVDISLLKENNYILDLGCNDFIFSENMINKRMKVIGVDPFRNAKVPQGLKNNNDFIFINKACTHKEQKTTTYYSYVGTGANSIINSPDLLKREINKGHANNIFQQSYLVETITVNRIMQDFNIQQFDLIKIDIEGEEYELLKNLPYNCAKQISVEFHDFLNLNPCKNVEDYYTDLMRNFLKDYEIVADHDNKSDVLFLLK